MTSAVDRDSPESANSSTVGGDRAGEAVGGDDRGGAPSGWRTTVRERVGDRTVTAIVAITLAALLARLVGLGDRVAHWDEARVAYWTLRYIETGAWEYRPIVHGPFLPQVNYYVFELLGPSDASSRLIVALVGGLLPLVALLFREHLRDSEQVALALFLAANPILLYYSRFMRNDVVLAAVMLFAIGFFVRAYDTRNPWYVHPGVALVAIGFTTMGNAVLYLLCWAGALALLLDHRLFRARPRGEDWTTVASSYLTRTGRGLWAWRLHLLAAPVYSLVILVWFYAPRAGNTDGIGLDRVSAEPGTLTDVVHAALIVSAEDLVGLWISGSMQDEPLYLDALSFFLETLYHGALVLCIFAVVGLVADRYSPAGPRDLVALCSYWGFVSVLGYPLAMDIQSPWTPVHAIVPLAVPAAVGVALLYRWGREAYTDDDTPSLALVAVVLLVAVAGVGGGVVGVYTADQDRDNQLVQFAQPAGDMKPTLAAIEYAIESNDGDVDVVFFGEHFYMADETFADYPPVVDPSGATTTGGWFSRLPLPWYTELYGAQVASAEGVEDLDTLLEEEPPVVIAQAEHRGVLDQRLDGYTATEYELRLWGHETVFYVDESRL